jgi:hypothetical protein
MMIDRAIALTDRAAKVVAQYERLFALRREPIADLRQFREQLDRLEDMIREALSEHEVDIRAEYSADHFRQISATEKSTMLNDDNKQLPVPAEQYDSDGFDDADESAGSFGPIEKFLDGDWSIGGVPSDPKRRLVAVHTESFIRRWKDKQVIETIKTKPLPNLDDLNATVPKDEWELDLNGAPRKPYELAHRLDLLNLDTAEHTTFISATKGAGKAVSLLKDQVQWMRRMRGNNVVPQVMLGWAPFKTGFGMRKRPDFKVTGWFDLSASGPAAVQAPTLKQLPPVAPTPVKTPSTAEDLDDQIPF